MTAFHHIAFNLFLSLLTLSAWAHPFKFQTQLSHQKIVKDAQSHAYLKVALTGLDMKGDRPPLNIALVIDRSGSMSGQRLHHAKQAAEMAIRMLKPDDIISLIAYNNQAHLLMPATKVGDGSRALKMIKALHADGGTALFAGTEMGGQEVAKFIAKENVNRVVLLSDGIANVGPSSPAELANLGKNLVAKGISVSTIGLGLGYNEDLMARLADSSDGNHSFVEHADQLAKVMSLELNDALAVVAQQVEINVTFPKGIRPVRALGRKATFNGQQVSSSIKQLITGTERFILIEVEMSAEALNEQLEVAQIEVKYRDHQGEHAELKSVAQVQVAETKEDMEASVQASVMESVVELIAREQQEMAISFKDKGDHAQAAQVMQKNHAYLKSNAIKYKSKKLQVMEERAQEDEAVIQEPVNGQDWSRTRKAMRKRAYSSKAQMAF